MTSRLSLDYEAGCFLYFDPDTQKHIPCDGVVQVVIGLNLENDAVNRLPFLPIRLRGYKKDDLRTYRASCIQCLLKKQKQLCQHSNEQLRFRQTYTMNEVAYACSKLSYQLYAIEEALVYCKLEPMFAKYFRVLASQKIRFAKIPAAYADDLTLYC